MSAMDYEIDMTIPVASDVESEVQEVQEEHQLSLEQITEHLPHLEVSELLEILSSVNSLLKKKWKDAPKAKKTTTVPRKVSPALLRNQAWLAYVQKHAMDNGWDAFTIRQEKKDKVTGETEVEETGRSGSKPNDVGYTFKDAKTKETITPAYIYADTGKHLIYKEAMSLSAIWKWSTGEKPSIKFRDESEEKEHWSDLYRQFMEGYEENHSEDESSSTASTPSPKVRRLSAVEKEAEREEKRLIAEEEKAKKAREREENKREREEKKAREDAEKEERKRLREEKKAEKEREKAEKEEKKAEKEREKEKKASPPATAKKAIVPAKTVTPAPSAVPKATKAATASSSSVASSSTTASKAVTSTVKAKTVAPKQLTKPKMTLDVPKDGLVHDWTWENVTYLVNSDGYTWEKEEDGEPGVWVGMIDLEKGIIDKSVDEPKYDDE